MPHIKLTKRIVDDTSCPKEGQTFIRDTVIPGFAVRLTKGAKTFILNRGASQEDGDGACWKNC